MMPKEIARHMIWIPHDLWLRVGRRRKLDGDLKGLALPMSRTIIILMREACAAREETERQGRAAS